MLKLRGRKLWPELGLVKLLHMRCWFLRIVRGHVVHILWGRKVPNWGRLCSLHQLPGRAVLTDDGGHNALDVRELRRRHSAVSHWRDDLRKLCCWLLSADNW